MQFAMPHDKQPTSFFSLPPEVRVQIYKYALTREGKIMAQIREGRSRTITPSLLRICKQVHNEASPILYGENNFIVHYPKEFLDWVKVIGPENVRRLKRLWLFVRAICFRSDNCYNPQSFLWDVWCDTYSRELWCGLLKTLAHTATGLRYLHVYWHSEELFENYGAGTDVPFVRELACIQGLDEMVIDGFFAKRWPEYLQQKLGKPVWNENGISQSQLQRLRKYQRGTENLIP